MILNPLDDVGIDVVRETDIVTDTGIGSHAAAYAASSRIVRGSEPSVGFGSWTANMVGEIGNRYYILWNGAGPSTPTVTVSGFAITINFLAGTSTLSGITTAFNAGQSFITMAWSGTDGTVTSTPSTITLFGGADYHGHWGDGARQYDNGDDTTPGAVTHNGQGWPTWEPAVPDMRCLWWTLTTPQLTDSSGSGSGWPNSNVGTGSAINLAYDSAVGLYRTAATGTTTTGNAGIVMGGNSAALLDPSLSTGHVTRYEAVFRIPTLTNPGVDEFTAYAGIAVTANAGPGMTAACIKVPSDGTAAVAFTSDQVTGSTTTGTGITLSANTWYRVVIVCTKNTQVDFYLCQLGSALPSTPTVTITTNLPAHGTTACAAIVKNLGTTARNLDILFQMVSWNKLTA